MKPSGVLRFPGTNCDRDVFKALQTAGRKPQWLWHADRFEAADFEMLVLPGGFSYGDYLRSGALAARAPCMDSVREADGRGIPILGICNGFQILCEAGLLPGALLRNRDLRFKDKWISLEKISNSSFFAQSSQQKIHLPIAHADGRWVAQKDELQRLEQNGQIWWRYLDNPNGSDGNVAGVFNRNKNVSALMPHPERAVAEWMGSDDGQSFFAKTAFA